MNTIAAQIDYATEELAMCNKILLARANYRRLQESVSYAKHGSDRSVANEKACHALAYVTRLERDYDNMFAPADHV